MVRTTTHRENSCIVKDEQWIANSSSENQNFPVFSNSSSKWNYTYRQTDTYTQTDTHRHTYVQRHRQ